eukprot:CAMPEP_0172757072 /NCGR_PEP_ID=MMETSP1074-20121228/163037_1 /TAXON_ID=2916 /ORGANISM="Ceratium fusus, Strain PA161109" /LENGTH=399 /DNA_ID=CAMNT_0013590441 /DNA_START=90 /DNA_END=1286 /DNA_ORIENTATION=-
MPRMLPDLGAVRKDAGWVLSLAALCYVVVKPLALALSDGAPPLPLLIWGTALPGACFFVMAFSPNFVFMSLMMIILHICHAPMWPGTAGVLCQWFPPMQRGLPYSFLSAQINVASATVPLMYACSASHLGGWRWAFASTGAAAFAMALASYPLLRDSSQKEELEQLEELTQSRQVTLESTWSRQSTMETALASGHALRLRHDLPWQQEHALRHIPLRQMLLCVAISMSSMTCYLVRFGVELWIGSFFEEVTEQRSAHKLTVLFIFWWQVGGLVGTLVLGPFTDKLNGERLPTAALGSVVSLLVLVGFATQPLAIIVVSFVAGFFTYGTRVLLILAIRQAVPVVWGGRAEAVNFFFMEFGGVLGGWPLIALLERSGGMHHYPKALMVAVQIQLVFLCLAW